MFITTCIKKSSVLSVVGLYFNHYLIKSPVMLRNGFCLRNTLGIPKEYLRQNNKVLKAIVIGIPKEYLRNTLVLHHFNLQKSNAR